jgi:hypothetical protein
MLATRNLIRPCAAQTVGVPSALRRGFLIALKKIKKHSMFDLIILWRKIAGHKKTVE